MSDRTKATMRLPLVVLWLTILWVALWADISFGNIVGGLLVGLGVALVARPPGRIPPEKPTFRPFYAIVYGLYFLYQLVTSTLVVAWEIVTPGSSLRRAIIAVPLHTTEEGLITLVANSITLTPGTAAVDLYEHADGSPPTIYIHVLHFRDVESVRRDVLRLERRAIKAFGSRRAVEAADAALADLNGSHADTTAGPAR
jgi:multicomponent Na+:H+ antiporter subunit E